MAKKKQDDELTSLLRAVATMATLNAGLSSGPKAGLAMFSITQGLDAFSSLAESTGLSGYAKRIFGFSPKEPKEKGKSENSKQSKTAETTASETADDDDLPSTIRAVAQSAKQKQQTQTAEPSASELQAIAKETGLPTEQIQTLIASGQMRFKGHEAPQKQQQEPDGPLDLKSIITGAVEKQDSVNQGGTPVEQPEVPGIMPGSPQGEAKQPSRGSNAVDALQLVLDVVGAFDPTPITDGANAAISLGRAFVTDPERRKEHLQNAAISTVSMIPYIGDTAKLAKVPRAAKTVQRTTQAVRGADRAADGTKTLTAAQKRATREAYRDTAAQATSAAMGTSDTDGEAAPALTRTSAGNGSEPPNQSPPIMSPPNPGDNRGPQARTEEAEGIEEYYGWREAIKDSGKKLSEFGGTLGKGIAKAAAFVEGLKLFNNGVLAINRDLAAYNGEIAASYGEADAADIRRDMARGRALSGPISSLNKEQSELKDKLNEALMPIENVAIRTLTEITRLTNNALDFMGAVVEIIPGAKEALDALMKQKPDHGTAYMQFFQDVSDGKFDGKRPTFLDPKAQFLNDQDQQDVFGP